MKPILELCIRSELPLIRSRGFDPNGALVVAHRSCARWTIMNYRYIWPVPAYCTAIDPDSLILANDSNEV